MTKSLKTVKKELTNYFGNQDNVINFLKRFRHDFPHIDDETLKDIHQDASIICFENIENGTFKSDSELRTYIFGIGRNLIYKRNREQGKEKNTAEMVKHMNMINKYDDVLNDKQKNLVEKALNKLEKKCKDILEAFYMYSKSMKDISEDLDYKNVDVAKSTKARCLKYLKRTINETTI